MPSSGAQDDEIQVVQDSRARASSYASSSRSGSSRDSWRQSRHSGYQESSLPSSRPSTHRKSGSFSKFFLGTKEPSLDSFKHLAQVQQKELEKKGQKVPFGVPQSKMPDTAKEDYKKAKQRAKENAKMHKAVKEKLKEHEQEFKERQRRKESISAPETVKGEELYRTTTPATPLSPKSLSDKTTPRSCRLPSLDLLPESPQIEGDEEPRTSGRPRPSHQYSLFPPRTPPQAKSLPPQVDGMLTGSARKQALPWE